MEEYTVSKNWEELVGSFNHNDEAVKNLLEYGPETVIIQILLNIPPGKLEAFCLINTRVRRICKSGLVKEQYYEKNPIFETGSFEDAKAYLEKNPKGFLSIKKDNDFKENNVIELANKIVFLGLYNDTDYDLEDTHFQNLKTWKFYYPNSNLLYKEFNYKDGKRNGLYRSWYNNGQLKQEYNYKDDELDGLYRSWHENGQLKVEANYKDGEESLYREWHKDGNPLIEYNYKDGALNGLRRDWYRNGQLKEECNSKNDRRDGLCSFWNEEGTILKQINYKDGKRDGLYRKWNEEGTLVKQINYKDGKKDM